MSKEIKKEDFWSCEKCGIDSNTKGRMIPCPRGFCDAEVIGEITITTEIVMFSNEKLRPICSCGLGEKVDGENYCSTCLKNNPLFIA